MRRRLLMISDARPAETGDAVWRRLKMMRGYFGAAGFEVATLLIADGPLGLDRARALHAVDPGAALADRGAAADGLCWLRRRGGFQAVHYAHAGLLEALPPLLREVALVDALDDREDFLDVSFRGADLALAPDARAARLIEEKGCEAVEAAFLGGGARRQHPEVGKSRLLAGCWVEDDRRAVAAVAAFFDRVRARGGGGAPNFAIAGPGAAALDPPPLPFPVTRIGHDIAETVFYRGLDLAVAPDLEGGPPRLDVISSLEHGAAPLASTSALTGVSRRWRLPHFRTLEDLADFLFERGADLRRGRLQTELRARADWTWSSLIAASARQREKLGERIGAKLREKAETMGVT